MSKITIEGQHQLSGEIKISGAKNSAVALLPAAVLSNNHTIWMYNPYILSEINDYYRSATAPG